MNYSNFLTFHLEPSSPQNLKYSMVMYKLVALYTTKGYHSHIYNI